MGNPDVEGEEKELALEIKRLELAELRRKNQAVSRLATPLTPTLLGLLAAAVGGLFQLSANRNLERDKFEYQILTKATELPNDAARRDYLSFVSKLGLIERRSTSVDAWLKGTEPVPRTLAPDAASAPPLITLSPEQLRAIMPNVPLEKAAAFAMGLTAGMTASEITTPKRAGAFLASVACATNELRNLETDPALFAGQGEEAVRYRGRGLIPFGGRETYAKVGKGIGLDLVRDPDQLKDPPNAALAAGYWWRSNGLNDKADAGDFAGIVRAVSGPQASVGDRERYRQRAMSVLGEAP